MKHMHKKFQTIFSSKSQNIKLPSYATMAIYFTLHKFNLHAQHFHHKQALIYASQDTLNRYRTSSIPDIMANNVEHIGTHIIRNQIKTLQNVYSFVVNQIEDNKTRGLRRWPTRETIVLRWNKFNPGSTDIYEFQVRTLELFVTSVRTPQECVH